MTTYRYGWEDVTAGARASTYVLDSTTEAAGGTLRAHAGSAINGGLGARCLTAAAGAFAFVTKTLPAAVPAVSFALAYRQPPTNPSGTQQRVVTLGSASVLRLDQHTDGTMLVRDADGLSIGPANPALGAAPPAGTPVLWQVYAEPTGGYVWSTFTRLDTLAVIKDSGLLTGRSLGAGGTIDAFSVGWTIASKTDVTEFAFDDVALDDAPGSRGALILAAGAQYPAPPLVVAYSTDGAAAVGAQVYYSADGSTSVRVDQG